MEEMVYRRRRRRRVRMLDERRWTLPIPTKEQLRAALAALVEAAPGFLLALADVLEMPSGLHAAYIAALAALGRTVHWPVAGAGAAMLVRLLSGLDPRWEGLMTLSLLLLGPKVLKERGNAALLAFTAVCVLPSAVRGWLAPLAMDTLLSLGAWLLSTLSAPLLCRGVKALTAQARDGAPVHMDALEDRLGAAYLVALLLCGGARLLLPGVNVGMLLAALGTLALGLHFGAGAGCAAGVITGTVMTLMGMRMHIAVALAAGGFLSGVMSAMGRRWVSCAAFGAACLTPLVITGTAGFGCGGAVAAATVVSLLAPEPVVQRAADFLRRFRGNQPDGCSEYAASMLSAWEKTVDAMAMSVPVPQEPDTQRSAAWWAARLCEGCPDGAICTCMSTGAAQERAESVWACRETEEPLWQNALEGLRGLGCQRLYHLRQSMEALRQEEASHQRQIRRAREQRSMLLTHLTAMAGAARRFAYLSHGETWWETLAATRIRQALSEGAAPVRLRWVRRVQGHVQACFQLEEITGARRQAEALCTLVAEAAGAPMMTASVDGACVRLTQRPPMEVLCGIATACAGGQQVCGDTAWYGQLQDGRFMAAVSDGMGHGESAALSSRQTVELLRLCLDAGYTLPQTLSAVNGMMLLGGVGERFITVDLVTIDLWTGQAMLEKLGAACSWAQQQGRLQMITGDALPLGILEGVEAGERVMRLTPGDALVLVSDGVEEAFASPEEMEDAVSLALAEPDAQHAADSLMAAAQRGSEAGHDDQSVVVIRLAAVQTAADRV